MIRIRKNKTTRKKLTGPSEGKPLAEKAAQISSESREQSRDQFKGQSRDQFKSQPREQSREQFKAQPREQSREQFKAQPRGQFKSQPREQSKDQFRGDQNKKRRLPYSKKAPRERMDMPGSRVPREVETPEEDLEKGGFVLPGELVGTTEEFKPGAGTTISAGDIYSTATGNVIIDRKARIVSVKPNTLTPNILKVGDILYGKITDVRESGAMVEIAGIEGKEDREVVNSRLGDIHVSNVRDSYVKRLADEFRPSDIIRARVVDTERIRLTTAEDSLGVVKAYCSNCRGELVLEGKKLKCPACNMTETRKISTEYGKGIQ
ncbi:MAG TPA: exosome complex RNA-binding protein Csl4 [Methanosarcina barkeri]|jgi:exosome complex component CSL4|nr:exosome complex RNA-binding protein Csl4 [Methanosarcina barkeri]